jgi:hypothetical protein
MPKVLTKGSSLTCAHQGTIKLTPSQTKLKVDGQAVLVDGDLVGATVSGCTTPTSQTSKPCSSVVSMMAGAALHLKVGGKGVLLDTAAGLTDGLPTNSWSVQSAGQTKLDAS